jgi:hypothetical protein
MAQIRMSAEQRIDAPAEVVYHCIADYVRHHNPSGFLPSAFSDLVVEQGGVGDGTVIRFNVTLAGQTRPHRARITEPQPGRVLVESEDEGNLTTTFSIEPVGQQSRVRFDTVYEKPGIAGWVESMLAPRMMRGLYAEELAKLERTAQAHGPIRACVTAAAA